MKFLFVIEDCIRRKHPHTYENYINKGGFSGTETQIIEMVNHLNIMGHEAHIIKDSELQYYKDINTIDVFCLSFYTWLNTVINFCRRLNNKTKILLYMQSFADTNNLFSLKKNFYIVGLSDYVKKFYHNINNNYPCKTIYNGINDEIFTRNDLDYNNKKGNYIFFATYERGGDVCVKIFNKLKSLYNDITLHISSYELNDKKKIEKNSNSSIITYMSLCKKEIKNLLDKCDYFIYPLVNIDNGSVHHDTFACVVLEAMACGVTVLTWDVACMKSIYGDYIELIPPPKYPNYHPFDKFGKNNEMYSEKSLELFVEKIKYLEDNPDVKINKKLKAIDWALKHNWKDKTKELLDFLSYS